jgi:hypothetical protein
MTISSLAAVLALISLLHQGPGPHVVRRVPRPAPVHTVAPAPVQAQPTPAPAPVQPVVGYSTDPTVIRQEVVALGDQQFGAGQGYYFALVIQRESGFNPYATNPSSGACSLVQADPCGKLPCSLSDVPCQLNWGVAYIRAAYGTPQAAWASEVNRGWY